MTLPAHFWVWMLAMTLNGQTSHLQGYAKESTCRDDIVAMHANSAVKLDCVRVMIVR